MCGCISVPRSDDGRSTPFGQFATHSWQPVQCCAKCLALKLPAGRIGVSRTGTFLSRMVARPPSTFLSFCAFARPAASNPVPIRKLRRLVSTVSSLTACCALLTVLPCFCWVRRFLKLMAFALQASIQSKQATQRLVSTFPFLKSMADALHFLAQSPQFLQAFSSITGRNMAYCDTNPSTVPTGQMVLHQVRPFFQARTPTVASVTMAVTGTIRLLA